MARLFAVCLLLGTALAAEVSPVGKVVELLDDLKGKVQHDLATEGKAMEEYTNFCDSESSEKAYGIKTAEAKEADLGAVIQDSDAQIAAQTATISELGSVIAAKESEMAEAKQVRADDHTEFLAKKKELIDSVDEFSRGVVQVKKQAAFLQQGRPGAKAALRHSKAMTDALSKLMEAEWVDAAGKRRLTKFLQEKENAEDDLTLGQPQGNVKSYESHSGGIVGTLEDMQAKAETTLSDTRKQEMKDHHNYELLKLGLEDEVKLNNRKLADAKAGKSAAAEALAKAQGELVEVSKTKAADEEYKTQLDLECQQKAEDWAARQKSADDEIAAVDKAKEILENGVKAFVQVGRTSVVKAFTRIVDEDLASVRKRARVNNILGDLAKQFHSFKLVQLSSAAKADPFGKVRGLVEDMITQLVNQANEEASQKAFCDEETAKSTKSKEEKMMKLDKFQARIDDAATSKAELAQDIKTLQAELAESDAAMATATKIRNEEHADYLVASKDYKDSANAVMAAIQVLKQYYEGGALIQESATTKTRQPSFGSAKSDAGGSILEILEVAESDFTKLSMETETEETAAADAYEKLSQESAVTKTAKEAEVKGKESEIKSLAVALGHFTEDKSTTGEELDAVLDYLSKLKPECTAKTMSYEERKARREQEVEGLREALAILNGDQVAFVQTHTTSLRAGK